MLISHYWHERNQGLLTGILSRLFQNKSHALFIFYFFILHLSLKVSQKLKNAKICKKQQQKQQRCHLPFLPYAQIKNKP